MRKPASPYFTENPDGTIDASPNPAVLTNGVEVFSTFGASKGAYRSGVVWLDPMISSDCGLSSGTVPSCRYFTGDCEICPADPNAYAGEISCFCMKSDPSWSVSEPFAFFPPPATSKTLDLKLVTDWTGDGTIDDEQFAKHSLNGGRDQMRIQQLNPGTLRVDWEDIPQGPAGDFNDLTFFMNARECATETQGFPFWAQNAADVTNTCGNACVSIQECDLISLADLKFSAMVSVDAISPEWAGTTPPDREPEGRLIFVTVQTFAAQTIAGTRMAVCPTLRVSSSPVETRSVGYGVLPQFDDPNNFMNGCETPTECCGEILPPTGDPICAPRNNLPLADNQFLALSRDQHYVANQCIAGRSGEGDGFTVPSPITAQGGCTMMVPHTEHYQISAKDVDALLGTNWQAASDQTILNEIVGIDVAIISNLQVEPLYCPSGLNLKISDVSPTVGSFQIRSIPDNGISPNYREAIRQ